MQISSFHLHLHRVSRPARHVLTVVSGERRFRARSVPASEEPQLRKLSARYSCSHRIENDPRRNMHPDRAKRAKSTRRITIVKIHYVARHRNRSRLEHGNARGKTTNNTMQFGKPMKINRNKHRPLKSHRYSLATNKQALN